MFERFKKHKINKGYGTEQPLRDREIANDYKEHLLTFEEIGDKYGVSRERIRQIIKREIGQKEIDLIKQRKMVRTGQRYFTRLIKKHGSLERANAYIAMNKKRIDVKLGLRWSAVEDKCRNCGTTEKKHHALGMCLPCYERSRAHTEEGKIRQAKSSKKWRLKNPEKHRADCRRYAKENKEKIAKRQKEWLKELKQDPVRYAEYLEKHAEKKRKYYKENRDKILSRQRDKYQEDIKNPAFVAEERRKSRVRYHKRVARKKEQAKPLQT